VANVGMITPYPPPDERDRVPPVARYKDAGGRVVEALSLPLVNSRIDMPGGKGGGPRSLMDTVRPKGTLHGGTR